MHEKTAYQHSVALSTFVRHSGLVNDFVIFRGEKVNKPLSALMANAIEVFRQHMASKVAAGSVNLALKVLRAALDPAAKQGVFEQNPARQLDFIATSKSVQRRPFTLDEARQLMAVASTDWKTAMLVAAYTSLLFAK